MSQNDFRHGIPVRKPLLHPIAIPLDHADARHAGSGHRAVRCAVAQRCRAPLGETSMIGSSCTPRRSGKRQTPPHGSAFPYLRPVRANDDARFRRSAGRDAGLKAFTGRTGRRSCTCGAVRPSGTVPMGLHFHSDCPEVGARFPGEGPSPTGRSVGRVRSTGSDGGRLPAAAAEDQGADGGGEGVGDGHGPEYAVHAEGGSGEQPG